MADEEQKTNEQAAADERVTNAIDEIKRELGSLEEKGVDVGDAKAFVKHATIALEGKNLKKAVLLTVQAKKFMANAKKTLETKSVPEPEEGSVEPEPPEKTEDKEIPDAAAPVVEASDSVPANIVELNQKVGEIIGEKKEKGIDMSEAEGLFELAQKEIRLKEFKYLEEHLNKAMEIANRLEREYNERRTDELNRNCNEVQTKVEEIAGLGGDPGEIIQLLDEIKTKINNLEFDGAKELLQEGIDKVEEVMTSTLIGINKDKIMAVKKELDELKNEASRDFPGLSAIIRSGILALKEGRFDEIDVIIEEFHKVKVDDKKLYLSETLIEKMKLLDKDIEIITELGIEKGNADELMFSAREGLMKERFEEVSTTLANLKELLENIKTVKAKELTENLITEIEALLSELREKAVDVSEAEGLMEKASAQKEEEDFIESYRYCKQAKAMLIKARDSFLDRNLNVRLENMRGFAQEVHDIEYIPVETKDDFRGKLEEIGSLFGKEQFLEASKKLPSLKEIEAEMRKKIENHNRTAEQKEKVDELRTTSKELDIDISEEETHVSQAYEFIEESRFADAISPLDDIIASLGEKIDKKHSEIAASRFETAVNGLKANKEIIDDPERVKEEITRAKELIDKGDHLESIELSEKIIRDIDFFKEKNISAVMAGLFDNSQKLINGNQSLGIDVIVAESLLYRAKHAFENRKVESAKGFIKEAQDLMFSSRIEHFENINTVMGDLGLATDDPSKHIASLKELRDAGDSAGFAEMSEKLWAIVNDAEAGEAKAMAKELITRTKGKLTKLGGLSLDLGEEKSLFKDGIRAIKTQKYLEGCHLVLRTERNLLDTERNYYSDLSTSTTTELSQLIVEAEDLGLNVSSINETVEKSRTLLEEERFEEASSLVVEGRKFLKEMVNGELQNVIEAEILAFESTAGKAKELGIELLEETNTISSVDSLKQEGKFREALKNIKEAHARLIEKVLERTKEIKIKEILEAEQVIETLEKDDLHNELKFYLELASRALGHNDIHSADASLGEYYRKIENRENVKRAEELSEQLSRKEEEMASLRELDIDLAEADDLRARAAESLSRFDFPTFEEEINSISALLEEASTVKARDRARVLVGEAKQLLGQYKDLDVPLEHEKEMFKTAVLLIKEKEYVKGCQMTLEIKDLLVKAKPNYLKGLLDNIHEMVNENSEMGADVLRSEAFLYRAKHAFENRKVESAKGFIKEAQDLMFSSRIEHFENINTVMGDLGLATDDPSKHIASLKELRDAGDSAGFAEMSEKLWAIVNDAEAGEAKAMAKELITRTKGKLTKLGGLSLDLGEEKSLFKDGIRAIKTQKYLEGCHLVLRTERNLLDTERNYYSDLSTSTTTELSQLIVEAEDLGLNVSSINETVEKSRTLLEEERFEEASSLVVEGRKFLKEMVNGELQNVIEAEILAFESTAGKAKELGIELLEETNTISSVDSLKQEGKFREALKNIKEAHARLIEKVLERTKEIKIKEILEAEQVIETLEKDDLHNELKFYLELASRALGHNDIHSADASLGEYYRKIENRENVKRAEELSEQLSRKEEEMASLRELDIDLAEADDLRARAAESLSRFDFPTFEEEINSISALLEEASTVKARDRARVLVGEAKQLLGQYKDLDVPLEHEKEMFKTAVLLIKEKEYVKGCQMTLEIKDLLVKAKPNYLKGLLDNIHEMVNENSEMGADVLRSEAFLYKATYLFDKEIYDNVQELVAEAESTAMLARKDFYLKNVKSLLEEAGELMEEAGELDVDISRFEKVFKIVSELYDGGKLEKANKTAVEAMEKLTETIYGKLQDIIAMKFPTIQNEMDEAKDIGADITEEIEEFLKIEVLNKEGKYREVINEVEELKRSVDRKISLRRKEMYLEKIEKARKDISEISAKTETEYPDLAEYIDSGLILLESGDYVTLDGVLEVFTKSKEEHLNSYRREQYQTEIMQLEEMMAEMKALGIDLPGDLVANLEELKKKEE